MGGGPVGEPRDKMRIDIYFSYYYPNTIFEATFEYHLMATKDYSINQDMKCRMKWCLIHEMLGCIYGHLVLEVGLCDFDNSFHISCLYIENFWVEWITDIDLASTL